MQIKQEALTPTSTKLIVTVDKTEIEKGKQVALKNLGKDAKLAGFREGKAPAAILEKSLDPAKLQNEFLNETINTVYASALMQTGLKVVKEPDVSVTKFVPFTELEFTVTVEIVGDIKLADYKKIKMTPEKVSITAKDVDEVLKSLSERSATRAEVKRAAKNGDETNIDFKGVDAKTKEPIEGADGKDYDLLLGSKAFIPGFEEEVIGLKAKDEKTFDIVFPEDYGVADLKKKKVTFTITVNKVSELKTPKLDDAFAKSVGPFKNLAELKEDIKKQLTAEKQNEADQKLDNDLMKKIADQTDVAIPDSLIEQEIDRLEDEERRNLIYRGQTWQEHLEAEGITAEEHREKERPVAVLRIKTGLILGEIAEKEGITVNQEELKLRLDLLRGQYTDPQMQAELESPDGQRDIRSRMLVEKTLLYVRDLATSK
jgi:trigger factor